MRTNNKIRRLIDKIVALYLNQGVQPSEIADAVFEKEYSDIQISKKDDLIVMVVTFVEDDEDLESIVNKFRYTYSLDKCLLKIEQKIGNRSYRIQWDREDVINSIVRDLERQLTMLNNSKEVNEVISQIPCKIQKIIKPKLYLAA